MGEGSRSSHSAPTRIVWRLATGLKPSMALVLIRAFLVSLAANLALVGLMLIIVVASLVLLHRLGLLPRFSFSWDLVCRIFVYILLMLDGFAFLLKTWSIIVILAQLPGRWLVSPSADPAIDVVSTTALGIALYGVWRWRKWATYLVLIRLAFTMAVQLFVYPSPSWRLVHGYTNFESVFTDLSGVVLWTVAFSLTWEHFE